MNDFETGGSGLFEGTDTSVAWRDRIRRVRESLTNLPESSRGLISSLRKIHHNSLK